MTSISNKTIIITGASRGIGRATALLLAQNGANVVAMARNEAELSTLAAEAATAQLNIKTIRGDVSVEADAQNVIDFALAQFGRIDLLINNAGYGIFKNVEDITLTEWDDLMATNARGMFLMTKAVLPHLKAQMSGHIINIASDVAKRTFAGGSLYTASKYAQEAFTGSLRKEARAFNVKVSAVYSGLVDSHFHDKGHGHPTSANWLKNQDMAEAIFYIASQPAHVVIDELMIHPLEQDY